MINQSTILITGAAGGLGSELAVQLSRKKANLLLTDKDSRGLDQLSDKICAMELDEPGICPLNLAKSGAAEVDSLVQIIMEHYGQLDTIIHCAASFQGLQPIEHISTEDWQECFQVNLTAAWMIISRTLPLLKSSRAGRIVLVHDQLTDSNCAYWGAYKISKSALQGLGEILTEELDGTKVDVMSYCPPAMRTDLRARAYLAENPLDIDSPEPVAAKLIESIEKSYPD